MTGRIDQMLADAREAAKNAEGEEKVKAEARAAAILEMKGEGFKLSADEVGGLVKRKEDEAEANARKWEALLGMSLEETEKAVEDLDVGEEDEDEETGTPGFARLTSQLQSLQAERESGKQELADLRSRYSADKVEVAFDEKFRDARIDPAFLDLAKEVAKYDDIIQEVASGKPVPSERINERVESIKTRSGVWFKPEGEEDGNGQGSSGGGRVLAGGYKLKEEAARPHIPATPNSRESTQITDEDRAARAASVY